MACEPFASAFGASRKISEVRNESARAQRNGRVQPLREGVHDVREEHRLHVQHHRRRRGTSIDCTASTFAPDAIADLAGDASDPAPQTRHDRYAEDGFRRVDDLPVGRRSNVGRSFFLRPRHIPSRRLVFT
jgi:hypothetical protein